MFFDLSRFDDVINIRTLEDGSTAASQAELGALCNAAKYVSAEAAFEACERAGGYPCIVSCVSTYLWPSSDGTWRDGICHRFPC